LYAADKFKSVKGVTIGIRWNGRGGGLVIRAFKLLRVSGSQKKLSLKVISVCLILPPPSSPSLL